MISREVIIEIAPLIFIVAALYSSVGHGGASGYLATVSLVGISVQSLVPAVLVLNTLVASISFLHFRRSSNFSFNRLLPFVVTSIPAAYVGGMWRISGAAFQCILGVALVLAALRLFMRIPERSPATITRKRLWGIALPVGLALGLVSGMIGIGGGVFLSPLLLFLGLADIKETAAMSSAFIVLNSLSGLAGHAGQLPAASPEILLFIGAGLAGALLGSNWGAFRIRPRRLRYVLASVLLLASVKLIAAALPIAG